MKSHYAAIIILAVFASVAGGVFIFNKNNRIIIQNIPEESSPEFSGTRAEITAETEDIEEEFIKKAEEIIGQAQILISETQKFLEQEREELALIGEAREKSSQVKGVYAGAAAKRQYLKDLLDETELNGIVIDVKEYYGINLSSSLKNFVQELHQQDVWVTARIVVFRDSSLVEEKPEWHLSPYQNEFGTGQVATSSPWRDKAGYYWLDPRNEEVQDYVVEFSKRVIDFGFDELQFDYIRYPDDYGYISGSEKVQVIGDFFSKIAKELKDYKPATILSIDLFGYIATQYQSFDIGQRLADAQEYFDYLSFMLYPSHFYGGFSAKGVSFFYPEVVEHPYEVVYYSILSAGDPQKIRPWLQDFNLRIDTDRGVVYDAEKIRAQIRAAEDSGASGWLLWNPRIIYTHEALK